MAKSESIRINSSEINNPFLIVYMNDYVKKFREYNSDEFLIIINGLNNFIPKGDQLFDELLEQLYQHNFTIVNEGTQESINEINITCKNVTKDTTFNIKYQIQNLPAIVEISSKTDIPLVGIIITKIIAQILGKFKTVYKAIVLDLDDTLWMGTISEDGIDKIRENMISEKGAPFIEFMKFIKTLSKELGIFIALCSRNNTNLIESTINGLDENIFPLKNQIDYIIANSNDKSDNIKIIAEQLSILPNSMIFIDDNKIVRDEVKIKIPEVFIPEWTNHTDIVNILSVSCVFERNELSLNSQNRRKQYRIIQSERIQNSLPKLFIKTINDGGHFESRKLYSKSNQFKFSRNDSDFGNDACSLYFEIIRENGENLGVCSTITYSQTLETFHIHNWALSCRYFEMGLEEYILHYIYNLAKQKKLLIDFEETKYNQKACELLTKYSEVFIYNRINNPIEIVLTNESINKINQNTNLRNL
jgi:HAD superfamily phosphatase (TIGR01681 family)